ncbi:MAG: TetR family transcriptional regulator [endosymbiont of Galathealinum brachiosum]|uniref:TetR family transcriptional regulator n=1 Tax=endosymbiont of Galathealinum brachiosum TaxID=2200906 RepID=A0A370DHT0_9GAMM|nr:MAG: TetR family transcriptional regulator [endosymbiont of Galathealinum brachiosum]
MFCDKKTDSKCRWKRRKEARPEEILDAALQLFTEKGFSSTRMVDVAKSAGISKGTLYLYFDSKEAIFKDVVQQRITPQLDEVEAMVESFEGSQAELLKQLINGWWMSIACTSLSAIPKIIVAESGNFPELASYFTQNVVIRSRNLFSKVISRGMINGEFNLYESEAVARLVVAPLVQATIWMHSLKPYDDESGTQNYLQLHTEFILNSLVKQPQVLSLESNRENAHS